MKPHSPLLIVLIALAAALVPAQSSRAGDTVKGAAQPSDQSRQPVDYSRNEVHFHLPAQNFTAGDVVKTLIQPSDLTYHPKSYAGDSDFFFTLTAGCTMTLFQWPDDRWMLNVEPGCLVAEVKHEKIGRDVYRFSLLGWGMIGGVKKALSIQGDHFEVRCWERKSADLRLPSTHVVTRLTEIPAPKSPSKSE
ncbi:hypothetical protein [Brevifollis gellanilyticus]|nr:hypothetical protein [Brevifollis gellanilyticus]